MQSTFLRLIRQNQPVSVKSRFKGSIYFVDPAQLLGGPNNCFINTVEQQNAMIAHIATNGWIEPLINNKVTGELVKGHGEAMVALSLGLKVPVQDVYLSREEQRSAQLYLNAIAKLAQFEKETTDETIADIAASKNVAQRRLLSEMVAYDVIPATGTRLRTRTEQRDAPLEQQDCIKRQCRKGEKELWQISNARVFGTPEECAAVVTAWEQATGNKAVRLVPGQLSSEEEAA